MNEALVAQSIGLDDRVLGSLPCPDTPPVVVTEITVALLVLLAIINFDDVYLVLTRETTYLITYSMVQNIILKADCHSVYQKISCFLCEARRFITVLIKARHWTLS
jgi:hypothetical protein